MNRYAALLHVVLIAVLASWCAAPAGTWFWSGLTWLGASGVVLGLAFPWPRRGETPAAAGRRTGRAFWRDPFVLVSLLGLMFFLVQACNGGRGLVYDAEADIWSFSAPAIAWAPSHAGAGAGWPGVALFFTCACAVAAIRHGLGKAARLLLLQALGVNGAALALWRLAHGLWRYCSGLPAALPPADNTAALHMLMFAVGIGLALNALSQGRFSMALLLSPMLNFAGAVGPASGLMALHGWLLAVVVAIYGTLYFMVAARGGAARGERPAIAYGAVLWGVMLLGAAVWIAAGGDGLGGTAAQWLGLWSGWSMAGGAAGTAARLFAESPLFGHGAGGVEILGPLRGWSTQAGGDGAFGLAAVTLLANYGIVGCGLVAAAVGVIVFESLRRIVLAARLPPVSDSFLGRRLLFRLSPLAVTGVAGFVFVALAGLAKGTFDGIPAVLTAAMTMPALASFLPSRRDL